MIGKLNHMNTFKFSVHLVHSRFEAIRYRNATDRQTDRIIIALRTLRIVTRNKKYEIQFGEIFTFLQNMCCAAFA